MAEDELLKNFRGSAHVENGRPEMQSRLDCLHWFGTPVYVFGSINDPIFRVGDIFVALGYHHHLSVPYTVGDLNGRGHLYRVRRADFGNGRCNQYYGLDKNGVITYLQHVVKADCRPCRSPKAAERAKEILASLEKYLAVRERDTKFWESTGATPTTNQVKAKNTAKAGKSAQTELDLKFLPKGVPAAPGIYIQYQDVREVIRIAVSAIRARIGAEQVVDLAWEELFRRAPIEMDLNQNRFRK